MYIDKCPICKGKKSFLIAERKQISPYQNRTYQKQNEAVSCAKRDMKVVICESCGFIYNSVFDNSIDLYDGDYNNTQSSSDMFLEYMRSSIEHLENNYLTRVNKLSKVVEIGCGKNAEYLRLLCDYFGRNNDDCKFVGYDPSYEKKEEIKNITIYPEYYDLTYSENLEADLLVSRHVIEHLAHPLDLLRNVNSLNKLDQSIAFIETPDVTWILKHRVVFDFSYEHCSLFSPTSMVRAAKEVGVCAKEVSSAFGGQYMWAFLKNGTVMEEEFGSPLCDLICEAYRYVEDEKKIIEYIGNWLESKKNEKKIAIWGGAGKGNIFLNMFDSKAELIQYVIDKNSWKNGRYISGTGHKIYSPQILENDKELNCIIVMNANYYSEIQKAVQAVRRDIDIINIDTLLRNGIKQ